MEVHLDKRYELDVSPEQAWAVLSDVRATGGCMPGAQITEQIDDTHFKGTVKSKVGPAVMTFNGDIELLARDAATKSLQMMGKGADRSGSSASMDLKAHVEPGTTPASCVLVGHATIVVSGKLAQFGSRLLVPVSDMMLTQFAGNFREAAAAVPAMPATTAPTAAAAAATPTGPAQAPADDAAPQVPAAADASDHAPGDGASPSASSMQPAAAGAATAGSGSAPASASALAAPPSAAPRPIAATPLPVRPVKEINALAIAWALVKGWFAGLFGRKSGRG